MRKLQKLIRNAKTILRQPAIALDYASWALQTSFRADGPIRSVCGERIGNFNGFSEYHSVVRGISSAELAFLRRHCFGEGAVIDVGANLGLFSLVTGDVLPDRRIIAFELAPSTFVALSKNIAGNAAANIECHQLAVSDRNGVGSFVVREHARANSSFDGRASTTGEDSIEIECIRLDRFVSKANVGQIALLKVDVEGYEISVFRGAAQVLSRVRPRVVSYFEVCPALARAVGFAADAAAAFLEEKGYALHRIIDDGRVQKVDRDEIGKVVLENWIGLDIR